MEFKNIILIRYGEIHLKGLNRPFFEKTLERRINDALSSINHGFRRESGRFYVTDVAQSDIEFAMKKLSCVFGIHSISLAVEVEKNFEAITEAAYMLMRKELENRNGSYTFKVFAKRGDKRFPMTSEEIARELGHLVLKNVPGTSVDVHNPEVRLGVEVRESAMLYTGETEGAGGLPVGTAGRAALLLSGGIDSPVAGYLLAKRGVELSAVHFHSYPYTSERAKDKVIHLAELMSEYTGAIRLHIVPFTEIQLALHEHCPEKETTLLMRRSMMRIAERIAKKDGALALITGESLGQVASQTLEALCVTNDAVSMPVFRPLIGSDKTEITEIARKINTFETSILPYEDCCTVFVPKHPVTKPSVEKLREDENIPGLEEMTERAIASAEVLVIKPTGK